MTTYVWPLFSGHTIFCDDIRKEASGKDIFIGVYYDTMIINSPLPVMLPSLSLLITYSEEINTASEDVRICVFFPGVEDPQIEILVDGGKLEEAKKVARKAVKEDPNRVEGSNQVRSKFLLKSTISPAPIKGEGRIRVRGYRGEDEIQMGTLEIKLNPDIATELEADTSGGKSPAAKQQKAKTKKKKNKKK